MSILKKSMLPIVVAMSVPLFALGGCAGHETVKITTSNVVDEYEVAESVGTFSEPVSINDSAIDSQEDKSISNQLHDEQEVVQVVEPAINVMIEEAIEETQKTPQPDEAIIGFAFDKSDIAPEYGELLWQHAQFLKENKNFILRISGHTDSTGNQVYNQSLSEKRANKVAKILTNFGVPKDRIKITGNASDMPLMGAVNIKEHRRVELSYEDTQLVSN